MEKRIDDIIGIPRRLHNCRLSNFKEHNESSKESLKLAKEAANNRSSVLLLFARKPEGGILYSGTGTGKTHLGLGILFDILEHKYIDRNGVLIPEYCRFITADGYARDFHDAGYNRDELRRRLLIAFDDGSGQVKTIMLDRLGEEDKTGIQCIKELIYKLHDDEVQMIITSGLSEKELRIRYGHQIWRRLSDDVIVISMYGKSYKQRS